MNILMLHYGPYVVSHGGGTKSDRFMIEYLASEGHSCLCLVPTSFGSWVSDSGSLFERELAVRDIHFIRSGDDYYFNLKGVKVHAVHEQTVPDFLRMSRLRQVAMDTVRAFNPNVVLVTGSDRAHMLLRLAVEACPGRVIYFVRATPDLNVGPLCRTFEQTSPEIFKQIAMVLCPSNYMKSYISKWANVEAEVLDLPVYGKEPFPDFGSSTNSYITMVNPCAVKGLSIFVQIASNFPEAKFAAVPTWGTTHTDLTTLGTHSNITILAPADDVDDVLRRTRILLVPSLWDEAFGMIVIESMLRGIPVLASDVGGLSEAKLGIDYLLPVSSITDYFAYRDERGAPSPQVPPQDITPWVSSLRLLLADPVHFWQLSRKSRKAAVAYVSSLSTARLSEIISQIGSSHRTASASSTSQITKATQQANRIAGLSPAARAVVARRLTRTKHRGPLLE